MNCLDYRRSILAGEGERADMRVHRLQCVACSALFDEQTAFEAELRRALEVPVPLGFEYRLTQPQRLQRRRLLAAAAVSAVAIGVGTYAWLRREDPLALACIQFVLKEESKSLMMGAMTRVDAQAAFGAVLPIERLERIGQLRHIAPCPFNGATAYHVILAVPQGKVTLLVMPGAGLTDSRRAVRDGVYARVIPLRGGSVGIVGSEAAVVDSVGGALKV